MVVGRENQGIRMSYILMIMHERVAGITKVGQIDSNICYFTLTASAMWTVLRNYNILFPSA